MTSIAEINVEDKSLQVAIPVDSTNVFQLDQVIRLSFLLNSIAQKNGVLFETTDWQVFPVVQTSEDFLR